MLKEYPAAQHDGESTRRWFADANFDLFLWVEPGSGTVTAFQLCYDKKGRERALTWNKSGGFRHVQVDAGEASPSKNRSPLFQADGAFPGAEVRSRFAVAASGLAPDIVSFVLSKLFEYVAR